MQMGEEAPVLLAVRLTGLWCVCVGGGGVASRRVPALLAAGARVRVIAPAITGALRDLEAGGSVICEERSYRPGDLAGATLVVAATGNAPVDAAVAAEAAATGVWACVAGAPELGPVSFMAVIRRGAVHIGIDSSGTVPALTAALRRRLERSVPPSVPELADALGAVRRDMRTAVPDRLERERRWRDTRVTALLDGVLAGEITGSEGLVRLRTLLLAPS
jgi:siroheme synthase-like protein